MNIFHVFLNDWSKYNPRLFTEIKAFNLNEPVASADRPAPVLGTYKNVLNVILTASIKMSLIILLFISRTNSVYSTEHESVTINSFCNIYMKYSEYLHSSE